MTPDNAISTRTTTGTLNDAPGILLDCDGVLVDNLDFDRRVTRTIIKAYARKAGVSMFDAEGAWSNELSETRGHPLWFDYAYHCDRLGLDGPALSEYAHLEAAELLTVVPGAVETHQLLQKQGIAIGVVTDATSWVVHFKLRTVGFDSLSLVFSSSDASATKATHEYWQRLAQQFRHFRPRALIDNRPVNLLTARQSIPALQLIQFVRHEHVTTLPSSVAPTSHRSHDEPVTIIHSHNELRAWVMGNMEWAGP